LSPLVSLTSVSLLRCYDLWACITDFWLQSWVCFFSAVTSAFQLFACKLCLQFSGQGMRNFTWNRFPIKKICWSIPCLHPLWKVHTWIEICASLNHRKKDESRWQSTDSSKTYRNTSAFKSCTTMEQKISTRKIPPFTRKRLDSYVNLWASLYN